MATVPSSTGQSAQALQADRRGEGRDSSCTRCELWVFTANGVHTSVADVVTRNASFCGLSIVARVCEPIQTGCPVEAVVTTPNAARQHVAGTVAFCREMKEDYYEIGIHVKAAGSHWILAKDPESAGQRYDWFAAGLSPE